MVSPGAVVKLPFVVTFERAKPGDASLVWSSWLRSYRQSMDGQKLSASAYNAVQRRVIDRSIRRGVVLVARPEDWSEGVLGWACAEPGTLHYLYVKSPYRRMGLGAALLDRIAQETAAELVAYSHRRRPFTDFLDRRLMAFDPA